MIRRLADPFPARTAVPYWLGRGWTTRRKANVGGSGGTSDDGGTGSGGAEDDDDSDDSDDDDNDNDDSDTGSGDTDSAKLRERLSAADRAKRQAEEREKKTLKRLQELEDKDKSALEVTERKLGEATKELENLKSENSKLRLDNAFALLGTHSWKKPATALRVAQAEGYLDEVIGSDGSVNDKLFKKKIAEFAKANPEFLTEKSGEDEITPVRTGGGVGGGGRPKNNGDLEAKVKKKYPNLLR